MASELQEGGGCWGGLTLCKSGAFRWKQVLTFSDTNLKQNERISGQSVQPPSRWGNRPGEGVEHDLQSVSSQEGKQRWNPKVWGLPSPSQARVLTTALREEAREGRESTRDRPGFSFCPQLTA